MFTALLIAGNRNRHRNPGKSGGILQCNVRLEKPHQNLDFIINFIHGFCFSSVYLAALRQQAFLSHIQLKLDCVDSEIFVQL